MVKLLNDQQIYIIKTPDRRLLVQSHQWEHHNNMRNLFKFNNKDHSFGVLLLALKIFHICSGVSAVVFGQVHAGLNTN